ncbi:MAG: RNA polymerase sigma factor [Acidobacteriota bacterium]|jgi:RNA polymerase sigma-70 factor (ECF subfamily)
MSPSSSGRPLPGPDPLDEALLRRIRAGDVQALERLVERKRERALRLARHVVGDDDDAKDVVQMAFIRVWRNLGEYRQGSGFDPWFHRIVMNLAIDFRRRAAARRRGLEGLAGERSVRRAPGPSEGSLARDEVSRIFDELARDLPPQQRAAFALREVEGMDTEEVARILGVRPSTVRNHLFQARRTLQRLMRERYPEYVPGGRRA